MEVSADLHLSGLGLHLGDIGFDMTDGDDGVTFTRQPERHRFAESAQPACNQRNPVLTIVWQGCSPTFSALFPENALPTVLCPASSPHCYSSSSSTVRHR